MNGKLGYWHRYWVQCEQSKVSFYDFIHQQKVTCTLLKDEKLFYDSIRKGNYMN